VSKAGGTTTVTISAAAQQNTYSNISDGTTTASAGSITDTIKFRAVGTGLSVAVGSNDATHGDNVLYTVTSTANADATSLVARDANGEAAFRGLKLNTASTTTAAHMDATTATFAAAGAQTIASYSGATYKAAKVIIRAGQGTNFQVTELLVINDGAATPAVNHVEYGFVDVGTPFSVTYNAVGAAGNTVNITADAGATSTVYTVEMVELV
jgi:flagellar capping protein FliD